jgi:hypothetical protein
MKRHKEQKSSSRLYSETFWRKKCPLKDGFIWREHAAIVPMKGQLISGSKKVSISRANPFQMPLVMDVARLKTITYRAI